MNAVDIRTQFREVLNDIEERSMVTEQFVDKDLYRLYLATLWANVVLNPVDAGLEENELELLHEYLNERIAIVLGNAIDMTECFRFINSKAGELAMNEAHLNQTHRELLLYFSSMILDPDGHRRWMEDLPAPDPYRIP
jgi:hypothetical protein